MKYQTYIPTKKLQPYVKHYAIIENDSEGEYKVFPATGLVIGIQYKGHLSALVSNEQTPLNALGITGLSDSYKVFRNSANIGTVLIYFTETGFTHFTGIPANELFNLSIALEAIFDKHATSKLEETLTCAANNTERIACVDSILLGLLRPATPDTLVAEAVRLIYNAKGNIRIKELNNKLYISQSPLEKRFRKIVGTTPKKFASIVRFNSALKTLHQSATLTEHSYENNYFDQSHFIKEFKHYTGETPVRHKRLL